MRSALTTTCQIASRQQSHLAEAFATRFPESVSSRRFACFVQSADIATTQLAVDRPRLKRRDGYGPAAACRQLSIYRTGGLQRAS